MPVVQVSAKRQANLHLRKQSSTLPFHSPFTPDKVKSTDKVRDVGRRQIFSSPTAKCTLNVRVLGSIDYRRRHQQTARHAITTVGRSTRHLCWEPPRGIDCFYI